MVQSYLSGHSIKTQITCKSCIENEFMPETKTVQPQLVKIQINKFISSLFEI